MASSALLAELEKQFSENPRRVFARLANEYRKAGDVARAIEVCRAHVPQQPSYISGHIVLGQALMDDGQYAEARQTFETALSLDPENLIALRSLGDIARIHGDVTGAREWYTRLLDVDPQNPEVLAQLETLPAEEGARPEPSAPSASELGLEPTSYAAEPEPALGYEDPAALREGPAPAFEPGGGAEWGMLPGAPDEEPAPATDMVAEHEPLDIPLEDASLAFGGDSPSAAWDAPAPGAPEPAEERGEIVSFESYGESLDFGVEPTAAPEPPSLDDIPSLDIVPTTFGEAERAPETAEPLMELEPSDGATEASAFEPASWTELPAEEAVAPYASAAELHGQAELPDLSFEDDVASAEDGAEAPAAHEPAAMAMEMPMPEASAEPPAEEPVASEAEEAAPEEEAPPAFVTETMAELYLRQGFREEALGIYRRLVEQHPGDVTLRDRVEQLERELAAGAAPAAPERERRDEWSEDTSFATALGFDNDVRIPLAGASDASLVTELDRAPAAPAPQAAPRGPRARAFLAGLAERRPPARTEPSGAAAPHEQGSVAVATPPGGVDAEEAAAERLAGGFSSGGPATRAAGDDLSLDDIFGDAVPTRPGFSFDDFFSEPQQPQGGAPSAGEHPAAAERPADAADLEAFNAWLEGLKR